MKQHYFFSIIKDNDTQLIGTKGTNIQLLSRNGFNVPLSFCLTTNAYEYFIHKNNLMSYINETLKGDLLTLEDKSNKIIDTILANDIPSEILSEVKDCVLFRKNDLKWAVRSSSNLEDLPETSFAGVYDSYLNVRGVDDILNSIKKCWASLWNERAIVYREKHDLDHAQASMAIIIQEMVNAEYAGVIFTENPMPENNGEMIIEYCEGLGEHLVSGVVTPYSCIIDKSSHKIRDWVGAGKGELADDEIYKLSLLALKIEKKFSCPQDIEWALTGNKIFVLQTRPIPQRLTFEKVQSDIVWTRANVAEVLPNVITPLTWSVFRATLLNLSALSREKSADDQAGNEGIRLIHGRVYVRLDSLLNSFCYLPSVTPEVISFALGVKLPSGTKTYLRPNGPLVKLAQVAFIMDALRFFPRLSWLARRLASPPLARPELIDELITWNTRCFALHLKCTAYAIGVFGLMAHLLSRWMPTEADPLLPQILTGRENLQTAAQGISLWQLAEHVRRNSPLRDIIEADLDWSVIAQRVNSVDGGLQFLRMFQSFLDENGARAAGEFELAVPRWREDPTFVLDVMRRFVDSPPAKELSAESIKRHGRRQEAVSQIKASLGPLQRSVFTRLLASYSDYTTLRENIKYHLMEGYGLLRNIFLEMGADLAARGELDDANDVFFLTLPEVIALTSGSESSQTLDKSILERKTQHSGWESQDAPDLIVGDTLADIDAQAVHLTGIGCSAGTAKGVARVLFDPSEANILETGEILVARHTDPGWTPLFLRCKAVVTEVGGFLSHGATVAREYGIPAVVNVTGATTRIQTGDYILVDGTDGRITFVNDMKKF